MGPLDNNTDRTDENEENYVSALLLFDTASSVLVETFPTASKYFNTVRADLQKLAEENEVARCHAKFFNLPVCEFMRLSHPYYQYRLRRRRRQHLIRGLLGAAKERLGWGFLVFVLVYSCKMTRKY